MQSLWMLFASFAFSIMGVCVKLASDSYSTVEIVLYRGLVGVLFMSVLIRLNKGSLRTAFPLAHLWRGVVGVIALMLWFYAIGKLPLATGMTLNYLAPVWIAAILFGIGWWRGEKQFEWGLATAITFSFIGVTMLLRPSFHADQWFAGLLGLASSVLSALAYLQVRKLGLLGEPEYRVVFYFSAIGLAAGLCGTLITERPLWHAHSATGILLLVSIGVSATVAQIAMTRAYRLGSTLLTANLQYSGIVFASAWGVLIWGDVPGWLGWLGIAVILASGIAATYYNARSAAAARAQTTLESQEQPCHTTR